MTTTLVTPILSSPNKNPTQAHGSSSGHWYDKDGNLIELVPSSEKGKTTAPTLRHARKLQLAPGGSSVRGVENKPALVKWMKNQVLDSALTLPRKPEWTDDDFRKAILEDSEQLAAKARDRGTELHLRVEQQLAQGIWGDPWVEAIAAELAVLTGGHDMRDQWRSEVPGVHPLGYGTTVDLHFHGMVDGELRRIVVDLKGCEPKKGESLGDQRLWPDHHMQLASSVRVLDWNFHKTEAHILWMHRQEPKALVSERMSHVELLTGWRRFRGCLFLWQVANDYLPNWARPALSE